MSEEQDQAPGGPQPGPEGETGTPDEVLVIDAPGTEERTHVANAATEEAEVEDEEAEAVNGAAAEAETVEPDQPSDSSDAVVGESDAPEVAAEPVESSEPQEGAVDEPTLDLVDPDRLRRAVEAVLLVVDEPVELTTLAQTLAVPKPDVLAALNSLRGEYDEGERGMDLREVAGGWRLYSRAEFAGYVERFVLDGQQTRLTQAALETLSVIAYRQPVTRSRVSAIRGVGVDGVMRTLTTRGLVEECGTDAETGGGLYRTTSLFLEKLGLNSLEELPPLAPLLPDHTDLDPALSDG